MSGMAEPRILQVTYGAFSCTLEGFDDPVETLKMVAEYFRELAERDPGFAGAGPLPDADEMARHVRAAGAGSVEVRVAAAAEEGVAPAMPEEVAEAAVGKAFLKEDSPGEGDVPLRPEPEVVAEPVPPLSPAAGRPDDNSTSDPDPWAKSGAARPQPAGPSREGRRLLASSPDEEDALRRILSRAESHLADPEAARRRAALAHVKAAVAATEAGRSLGEVLPPAENDAPFREDLAAVRPPVAEDKPAAPPPLRLVASQRVDLPRMKAALSGQSPLPAREKAEAAPPPPPARPTESASQAAPSGGTFKDFADEVGAASLPDLLEAAAVWFARQDGSGEASRTRLLDLVEEAMDREPSREEALRVFGTLLREQRLARAGNGRFRPGPLSQVGPARLAG